ncbi:hypothetical protein IWQ60_011145 [Tieghemiomyces parasiticus]|uniref:Sfi1 spindle body domain-containing protein n=1 Tax=Tieghemiomyces parasiticus TaxID=78921 RepID=A0A9W7ZJ97_9FUNG|nr:hypothetical protein IWQ60_011145 [Tieghemiomyces parasiticus]
MAKLADGIYQSNLLIRIIHRWSALARAEIYQSDTARALADRNRRTVARRLFCQWMRVVDDYKALERMAEKRNRERLLQLMSARWRERFRPVQDLDVKAGAYATRLTLIRAFSAWNAHTYRAAQRRVHERLLNIFQGRHDWRVKQHVVRALKLRLHRQKMVGRSGTRFSVAREKDVQRTFYYTWRRRIRHQARLQAHAAGIHHSRIIQHVWATWLLKFGESVADSDLAENFAAAQLEDSTRDALSGWCQVTLTLALQEREVRVLLEIGLKRQAWKAWSASLCSPVKQRREATAERWNQLRLIHQAWRHWWRHTQASRFLVVRHERQAQTILSHWRKQNRHLGRVKAQSVVYEVAARYRALRRVWQRWHDRHQRLQEAAQKMAQRSRTMRLVTFFAQWITSGMDREGLTQDALTHARSRWLRHAWDRWKSQLQAQYHHGEDLDVRARQANEQRILRHYLSLWKKVPVELKPAVAFIETNWQRRLIRKAWDHWQRRLHLVNNLNKHNDQLAQQQHAVLTRQAYRRWWAMTVARLEQMQLEHSEAHQIVSQKTLRQCLYYWKSLPTDLARRAASVRYTRQQDLKRRAWRCCVTKMTRVYEMAYDGDKLVAQRQLATLRKVWSAWRSRVTPSGRVAAPTPLAHRLRRLRALANVFSKRQAWRLMNHAAESMRERRSNHARLVEAHVPRALVARVPYPCYTALAHYHLVGRTWANWRALAGQRQARAQQIDATLRQYQLTRRASLWRAWQTRASAAGLARREQRCERLRVEFARRSAQRSRQASWKVWKGQVTTLRRGHRLRGQAEEHARHQLLRTALQTWRSHVQRRQHHERLRQLQRRLAEYARQRRARAAFLALAYGGLHRRPVLRRFFVRLERRRIEAVLAGRWGGVPRIPPLPAAFGRNADSVVELMDHYESRLATVADEVYQRSLLRSRLEIWKASSWRLEAKHRGMDRLAETWAAQLTKRHAKRTWLSRMSALRLDAPS